MYGVRIAGGFPVVTSYRAQSKIQSMRVWYIGCAAAFQAVEASSTLVARSTIASPGQNSGPIRVDPQWVSLSGDANLSVTSETCCRSAHGLFVGGP